MEEENDDTAVYTLKELIEQEDQLHEESVAVLGASDAMNCSYSKGYMKRQALYSCLTCNPSSDPNVQPAGVCLACSYKCHDKHDLVELYTKRNFRCDCGNKKFAGNPCLLQQEKEDENLDNSYNQNFKGVYCTCHRPYPDPQDESGDPMYQCVICEDWYHEKHSTNNWPEIDDMDVSFEMICGSCMPKYEFLAYYSSYVVKKEQQKSDENETSAESSDTENKIETSNSKNDQTVPGTNEEKIVASSVKEPTDSACILPSLTKTVMHDGQLWIVGWRKKLCRCSNCKENYAALKVSFLLDEEDTFEKYEAEGKAKEQCALEKSEKDFDAMFASLGRVGQIEAVHGINDMKESMNEFFKRFAENGQVIRKEDIQELFDSMKAKRRKMDNGFVPNMCR